MKASSTAFISKTLLRHYVLSQVTVGLDNKLNILSLVVAAFNQGKALVGTFSVIIQFKTS